eukprot:CAMPEP_0170550844 /NCGR_PEP_ID=MMETSP0211-20121228/8859_1 /TAXON_ID=311385 /ORGANISM="Pseudokeronopsis sp., Strain OXSARD2" /LENGTH=151 /DNA_ID=CAMNT_0010857623 /DNA_START=117 /DNA_END=572 /DNA_ORIENTATION=-
MVVNEDSKGINIIEITSVLVVSVSDSIHRLSVSPDILDRVVHGVVEEAAHIVLVVTHVSRVPIEALAHLEDASSFSELSPEPLGHMGNSVDSDPIEAISINKGMDPILKVVGNPTIFLVQVREVRESTVLYFILVAPVFNLADGVVVLFFV